jgi:hypothetical protein
MAIINLLLFRQTGSRNLTGPKTLPMIWGTYMKLVTKYQISAINSCWEKCDKKWAYMFNVYKNQQSRQTGSKNLMYRYTILWVAFLDPSDSYFLFADLVDFYTHWTYMLIFGRIFLSKSTIWYTYMMLVTKYQISAINSYWEKCDEKYLGRTEVKQYTPLPLQGAGV